MKRFERKYFSDKINFLASIFKIPCVFCILLLGLYRFYLLFFAGFLLDRFHFLFFSDIFYSVPVNDLLSGWFFPKHFYSKHRISLQCSEGVPCAFFISYPDGVSAVKAAAACDVQIIFRYVSFAAIAAPQNSMFAENKLPGQMQVIFQTILFTVPTIRFIEVQYFTQFIIGFYIHLKLSKSVQELHNSNFINMGKISDKKKALILKGFNWNFTVMKEIFYSRTDWNDKI